MQLSISVLHIKPLCHLQARCWRAKTPSVQTGSYYSRRLKFHLFSSSSSSSFSGVGGGGPATLISHCCQSNSTLSCNYFQYISIHISFRCHPNKIYKGSVVQSLICSTDPKTSTRIHIRTHRHTRTQASSHHPARGVLKWELWRFLWNKKKNSKNAVCVSSPASFSSGKSLFFFLRRVPTTFPVRLTRNEALCHCHIASPSCRSMTDAFKGRYIWWARSEKVWGGGKKRGTDIERVAEKKTEGRYGYTVTDELKHTSYQAVPKCLIPNWLFFFFVLFCFRKQQRSNPKYVHCCVRHTSSSTIQRRARRGFFTAITAAIRQKNQWHW